MCRKRRCSISFRDHVGAIIRPMSILMTSEPATGYFGKLPSHSGFIGEGLPPAFLDRWDNWYAMATSLTRPPPLAYDDPVWRFIARPGLFGCASASGVWRSSRDRHGQIFPFIIACLGPSPATTDPWFDSVESLLSSTFDGLRPVADLSAQLAAVPPPVAARPRDDAILVWRDDWEVHELSFPTARDFAAFGLPGAV